MPHTALDYRLRCNKCSIHLSRSEECVVRYVQKIRKGGERMKDDHNEQRDTSCGTVREGYISQIISFVYLIREAKIYSSAMGIDDCMVLFEKNNAKKIIIDFHEQYLHHIRTKSNDFYGADSRKLFKELLEVLGMRE